MCVCVYKTPVTQHCFDCWKDACLSIFFFCGIHSYNCSTMPSSGHLRCKPHSRLLAVSSPTTYPHFCHWAITFLVHWMGRCIHQHTTLLHWLYWLYSRPEAWAEGMGSHIFLLMTAPRGYKGSLLNPVYRVDIKLGSGQDFCFPFFL